MANRWGNNGNNKRLYLEGLQDHCSHEIKRILAPWKKNYDQPRQHIRKQRHYFANKIHLAKAMFFSSSHVWMWELDHKERWALKNWFFWTVVLEKTLESPLNWKEIQPFHLKKKKSVLSFHWNDWCWSWNSNSLATWCKEPIHWKRSQCWKRFYDLSVSMIQWILAIYLSFLCLSKSSLYIWKFLVHILLRPSLKDFEQNLASVWNVHNCTAVWTSLVSPFLGIGMKTDLSPSCWVFQICWHIECSIINSIIF